MPSPLNADQLDAFWTVVQAGGYHLGAERLHITQSAVTQRIQALEASLATRLFVRAGRGVALTDAGRVLARYCQGLREGEAALIASLGGTHGPAGRLAVAAGSAEGRRYLLPAAATLAREYPALELALTLDDRLDAVAMLEGVVVDAVLGETPVERRGLHSTLLGRSAYRLVAAPELAASWGEVPEAATLLRERAIDFEPRDRITLDHLEACLPDADLAGLRRHFVNDTMAIFDLALAGVGFAVLPEALLAPHLAAGRLVACFPRVVSQRPLYWTVPQGQPTPGVKALGLVLARLVAAERQPG